MKKETVSVWGVWLGLYRKADDMFYWIDDTPLAGQYSAWARGEPNSNDEKCVHMFSVSGNLRTWGDISCNLGGPNAPVILCQKKCIFRRSFHLKN